MKKKLSKVLALGLASSLVLSGCGGGGDNGGGGTDGGGGAAADGGKEITNLVFPRLSQRELETFNFLYSQRAEDSEALSNCYDGLLETDSKGNLVPCIAESYDTPDGGGKSWTFKIRDGVKWVDMNGAEKAACNAWDFATGLEWVLNYHKNDASNTAMPIEMIEGAGEYYEYTKSLTDVEAQALKADAGSKFFEMVGVEVPDDLTITYHCITEKPYFPTLGCYVSLYPAPQALIDELGVEGFQKMDNTNMWYNGCYTMTSFIQGNEKVFTKNPLYWDKDAKLFDTVTYKMVESYDVAYQLYESGELDYVELTESAAKTIGSDPNHKYYDYMTEYLPSKYSYQIHLNYQKLLKDGSPDTNWNTAAANKAFRQAMYYGLDLTEYYKRTNNVTPMELENQFYTMRGLVSTSDGTDYTELVRPHTDLTVPDGTTMARLNKEKAAELKAQAMEELTALGVTFPLQAEYFVKADNQSAIDTANVLKQIFKDCLGDDFIQLNVGTYVTSINKEVRDPQIQAFVINGWGADYGDPMNYLGQETYGNDNAYYSAVYSNINKVTTETPENKALLDTYKEYTALVEKADAINGDLDARYKAFAEAEGFLLNNALVIPCNYQIPLCLSKIDIHTQMYAPYGSTNDKMKNWETNDKGFTNEAMLALADAKD